MNENQKSLVVTGAVLLAMAAGIMGLLSASKRRPGPSTAPSNTAAAPTTQKVYRLVKPGSAEKAPATRTVTADKRVGLARRMELGMRARGRGITVQAGGVGSRVLQINWTVTADREHMENLKRARVLLEELKGLGFTRIEFQVRERKVWSRDL